MDEKITVRKYSTESSPIASIARSKLQGNTDHSQSKTLSHSMVLKKTQKRSLRRKKASKLLRYSTQEINAKGKVVDIYV